MSFYNNEVISLMNDLSSKECRESYIIFLSEGFLLTHLIKDVYLKGFYILILDEAHERSMNLDIILFLLKNYTLRLRNDFRLIITSATLDYQQLEKYFIDYNPKILNFLEKNSNFEIIHSSIRTSEETYFTSTISILSEKLTDLLKIIIVKWYNNCVKTQSTYDNDANIKELKPDNNNDNFQSILVFLPDLKTIRMISQHIQLNFQEYIDRSFLTVFELYGSLSVTTYYLFI